MSIALLVIDVQVGIMNDVAHADELLQTLAGLLTRARAAGMPVIHVQHDEPGELEPHTPVWEIHPAIAPHPGEPVIRKRACDAFHQTTLHEELQQRRIRELIITGCQTEYCVDTTCRRAVTSGYDVTLVKEGHGTMNSATLTADQIIAHHNAILNGFGTPDHTVRVRSVQDLGV
jgi:nicotinamidase-related amidase